MTEPQRSLADATIGNVTTRLGDGPPARICTSGAPMGAARVDPATLLGVSFLG